MKRWYEYPNDEAWQADAEKAAEARHEGGGCCGVRSCSVCDGPTCEECNDLGGKPNLEGVLAGSCSVCGRRA